MYIRVFLFDGKSLILCIVHLNAKKSTSQLAAPPASLRSHAIDHFTVVCSVTWPLNGSEAAGGLVLIKTSLLLLCKSSCSYTN